MVFEAVWRFPISWPDPKLSPNARVHWAVKAKAVKAQRSSAFWETTRAGVMRGDKVAVRLTFHPQDKRRRDLDNLIASSKGLFDGISDALGTDDSKFEISAVIGSVVSRKHVMVEIAI